jgi:two-component system cell cycle sensor histidine kinase/response regulator CckA
VLADASAVQQILLHLLTNARDAMPAGGTVRIELRQVSVGEDPESHAGTPAPGTYVCLAVRDTGVGMDAVTRARMFEPFFTTKPPGRGTGLGMPMVHGLVVQQGGFVHVESALGKGTTVRVCFPVSREPARRAGPPCEAVRRGTETILIAEDEEALRRSAKRALEKLGYTVLLAADGQEALALHRARAGEIHLIVADGVMPKLGGRELFAALRRAGSRARFLLASGYAPRDASGAADEPDVPFLPKPWTIAELGAKVRAVLDA